MAKPSSATAETSTTTEAASGATPAPESTTPEAPSADEVRLQSELNSTYGLGIPQSFAHDLLSTINRRTTRALRNLVESGKADSVAAALREQYGFKASEQFARDLIKFVREHDSLQDKGKAD
jgi:hypothetical protein